VDGKSVNKKHSVGRVGDANRHINIQTLQIWANQAQTFIFHALREHEKNALASVVVGALWKNFQDQLFITLLLTSFNDLWNTSRS
jgi:hypothetical protein